MSRLLEGENKCIYVIYISSSSTRATTVELIMTTNNYYFEKTGEKYCLCRVRQRDLREGCLHSLFCRPSGAYSVRWSSACLLEMVLYWCRAVDTLQLVDVCFASQLVNPPFLVLCLRRRWHNIQEYSYEKLRFFASPLRYFPAFCKVGVRVVISLVFARYVRHCFTGWFDRSSAVLFP